MDDFASDCILPEHALVVVNERDAVRPKWIGKLESSSDALVLNQSARESLLAVSRRALHAVERNERFRRKLTTVMLVASNDSDGEALAGRAGIARALIPHLHLQAHWRPKFIIVHAGSCSRDCQCSLLGLADVVVNSLRGGRVEVHLKIAPDVGWA